VEKGSDPSFEGAGEGVRPLFPRLIGHISSASVDPQFRVLGLPWLPTPVFVIIILMLAGAACDRGAQPQAQEITVWRPLGNWSGRALLQTDPFLSDTGLLRVTWQARGTSRSNTETFRISLHSDVSGRPLAVVVDHRGPGSDVAYVNEDPRAFFLVIESTGLEWNVNVAEGVAATRR
jgi:hypothetical protein